MTTRVEITPGTYGCKIECSNDACVEIYDSPSDFIEVTREECVNLWPLLKQFAETGNINQQED